MRTFILATAMSLCLAMQADATIWNFETFLDGLQETPPVATPGAGTGTATLDDVTNQFILSGSFSNLIGTTNNAHVHGPAPPGTPAGVLFGITFDFGVTSGNFSFNGIITPTQATTILSELSYVNIHTTFQGGGEIRGQLLIIPEPAACIMLALGAFGLLAPYRRAR